jgi:hypothetical protein
MGRGIRALSIVIALTSLPLLAAPQQSLGDLARKLRQQQQKSGLKSAKVYTNDNLSARNPIEGHAAASVAPSAPATNPSEQAPAEGESPEAAKPTGNAPEAGQAASQPEKPEDKKKTREYWQAKFKAARARVADAQERQQLAEDELNLLQIQSVHELDPAKRSDYPPKIQAKQDEAAERQAATEEARKALEDLQKEFQASGAPDEWSVTEEFNH